MLKGHMMSKKRISVSDSANVPEWNIDPEINKEKSQLKNKEYVVLSTAPKQYDEFKKNLGALTYLEIKLDKGINDPGQSNSFYNNLKRTKFQVQLSSQNDHIMFYRNKNGSGRIEKNIIKSSYFTKKNKYTDEYTGENGQEKDGNRVRVYLSAKKLKNKLSETDKKKQASNNQDVKVENLPIKIEIQDSSGKSISNKAVEIKLDAENVDLIMARDLHRDIIGGKLSKKRVMGSVACVHKLGEQSVTDPFVNVTSNQMAKALSFFLVNEGGKPKAIENIVDGKTYRKYEIKQGITLSSFANDYFSLLKDVITSINAGPDIHPLLKKHIENRLEEYLKLREIQEDPVQGNRNPVKSDGAPGFHAEIFAVNYILYEYFGANAKISELNRVTEITQLLKPVNLNQVYKERGSNFPACGNCTAILSGFVRTPTGTRYRL